jgi:hypothetical protein
MLLCIALRLLPVLHLLCPDITILSVLKHVLRAASSTYMRERSLAPDAASGERAPNPITKDTHDDHSS